MKRAAILLIMMMSSVVAASAAENDVVATVDGKPILEGEVLTPPVEKELLDLRQREYELKREALERHIFDQVLAEMAEKEGVPAETIWSREVVSKAVKPTTQQIASAMAQNRTRLPQDNEEAQRIIERYLTERLIEQRAKVWRDELLAEMDYKILLEPVRYEISSLSGDGVIGNRNAPVTIVEFSDFQCPYCAASQEVLQKLEKDYGDSVRIVFKHLPLDIHPQARLAAEASICAADQGQFRELHDWLFENPKNIRVEAMTAVAPDLGLESGELERCIQEKRHAAAVEAHMTQAADLGVDSTPTFFVNGRRISNRSYEEFSRLIDEELARQNRAAGSASSARTN